MALFFSSIKQRGDSFPLTLKGKNDLRFDEYRLNPDSIQVPLLETVPRVNLGFSEG
jgi:hypothetical protein